MTRPSRPTSVPHARDVALRILVTVDRRQRLADDTIDDLFSTMKMEARDRGFITELVYGVWRRRETLDWRLNHLADRPMARLPTPVAMNLRLGAYQIMYLDKVPPSAAVNEAVTLSRNIKGRNWSGVTNAILRNLIRHPAPPWPDWRDGASTSLSVRYACPEWLVSRWLTQWGEARTADLCEATLEIPPLTLRTNTLRCDRNTLAVRMRREGYEVHETTVSPVGLRLEKCGSLHDCAPLQEGWCYIEDEAAQLIPLILDPTPGQRVLDACAAPGGKLTHLGQLMRNEGTLVAMDSRSRRLARVRENCRRLGLTIVHSLTADVVRELPSAETREQVPITHHALRRACETPFDRVMVDAPCSGLGVLRRHPEGKWYKDASLIQRCGDVQASLLDRVAPLLRRGGVLVYSACSTEPEETSHVVSAFLERHPTFSQESLVPWLPPAAHSLIDDRGYFVTMHNPYAMDGFFAVRLRKDS